MLGLILQVQAVGSPRWGPVVLSWARTVSLHRASCTGVLQLRGCPRHPSGDRGRGLAAELSKPSWPSTALRVRAAPLQAACGLSAWVFLWAPQHAEDR